MRIRGRGAARWRHVPAGMRDQGADEVARRRRLEGRLRELFARWGYVEVQTPTLEYLETFLHGAGPGVSDRLLKLVDSGGEVLALRPELTVPLARFAATRLMPAGEQPLRLTYLAPVFRGQERGSGREREFTQAGVELIGDGSLAADVEVIALAAEALLAAGVERPAISVGHAGFLRGILATLAPDDADAAREMLYHRAFADLDRAIPRGAAQDALRAVPTLRGPGALGRAEALASSDESRAALTSLRDVLAGLEAHGQPVRVEVDLGLIRDFDYYSGIVFESHAARTGRPLLGGGRYDGLLARFGRPAPATGFALGLERILEAGRIPADRRPLVLVRHAPADYGRALEVARRLRDAGAAVVVVPLDTGGTDEQPAVEVTVDGEEVRVRADGTGDVVTLDDAIAIMRSRRAESWTP
ncbi:MAG: ATP phosphoribosyltransferase regulatory subunit [Armatimonadetes bacterium]|nr:ATP phosphoribosyltransferase regulatory subunit [Armatimonadota bacterium]